MGAKQLTKSAWESEAKKHKLEDKDLAKALAAYEKCGDDEHDAKEKALAEVEKEAEALKKKKEFAAAKDYLGEVADAAKEERKAVAKAAEEEGGEEEDEESAEYKKDLPKQLKGAMAKVKALAPGDPPPPPDQMKPQMKFVAYVAGSSCAVIVAKKAGGGAKKLVAGLAGGSGGKYFRGDCIFEQNTYTFVVDQMVGGLGKRIAKALFEECGQKYKVRVRGPGGEVEEATEAEEQEGGETEAQEPAGSSENLGQAFRERLTALMPKIKVAITAGTPEGQSIKLKTTEAGALAKQNDFARANGLLNEIEVLLGAPGASTTPGEGVSTAEQMAAFMARLKVVMPELAKAIAAGSPAGTEGKLKAGSAGSAAKAGNFQEANRQLDEVEALLAAPVREARSADFNSALAQLEPLYLRVMQGVPEEGTRMRALMQMAQEQAGNGDFAKALATLDQLRDLLNSSGKSEIDGIPAGLVHYRSALVAFAGAKSQAASQIAALKVAIPKGKPDEQELADQVAEYLASWNDQLGDTIDKAINAAKNEQAPLTEQIRTEIGDYVTDLDANPLIEHADSNPFAAVSLRATLGGALRLIETTMARL